ncbi:MAG: protein kinase [bacterium]|nr:protein kinase [bacterium]
MDGPETEERPAPQGGDPAGPPRPFAGQRPPQPLDLEIAGYRVLGELHRGGQGVVYEAIQESTKRQVAIKLLLEGQYAPSASLKRFEREIDLIARLHHPDIITVFDSGLTKDGARYCVMDYVEGRQLHQYVHENHLPLDETLRLFAQVCLAVQYAHQNGVIHRDLKPSNILVDAEGHPKVLDFGLAKLMTPPTDVTIVTVSREIIGTLPYMAPEQAQGSVDRIDTRTDVYALGVVLYQLLTGQFPYPLTGQITEIVQHIAETRPAPLTQQWSRESGVGGRTAKILRPGECPIDNEVQTIVLKGLAKEPDRRYQSTGELARDIGHYLAGEPIEAKRDRGWYVLRKTIRRYRAPIIAATIAVILAGLAVYQFTAMYRERAARVDAENRSLLFEADSRFNLGDYDGALRTAERILAGASDHLEASLIQTKALANTGQRRAGYDTLLAVAQRHPDQAAVYELLAELALATEPERSQTYLANARRLRKTESPQDYYLRSLAALDDSEAVRLLSETLRQAPSHFEALMARTVRHFRMRDYQAMRIDAERARTIRPDDARAWYNLGTALHKLKEHDDAVETLEHSVALNGQDASAWYNLGMAAEAASNADRAQEAFERAVDLDADHPWAAYRLGRILFKQDRWSEAKQAFEWAAVATPELFRPYYYLGQCSERLGDLEAALAAYRRCLDLEDAPRSRILVSMARTLGSTGDTEAALEAYGRAIEDSRKQSDRVGLAAALNDTAWILLTATPPELRDYARALGLASEAAETTDRPNAKILGTLALAELRTRDHEAAHGTAGRALDIEPDDLWALAIRAWSAVELGLEADARARWERIEQLRTDPDEVDEDLEAFLAECDRRLTALPREESR